MDGSELLVDAFGRIRDVVHDVIDRASQEELTFRPDSRANSIAWLLWHLTRVQDDHIADAAGTEQAWTADGWVDRFDLPFDAGATGYGQSPDDVAAVRVPSADLLGSYHDAVHDRTVEYVRRLAGEDFDRIVDEAWDPPVTLGVRLISVISDGLQHAGQAAYARGIAQRTVG